MLLLLRKSRKGFFNFPRTENAFWEMTATELSERNRHHMLKIKNYTKNTLNSFILLPLLLGNMSAPALVNTTDTETASPKSSFSLNLEIFDTNKNVTTVVDERAAKIDAYFSKWDLPLSGYGAKMVAAADKYGIDWKILPALAMLETTGGKNLCENNGNKNAFGFGGCSIYFKTFEEAFDAVAKTISGNGEKTAHLYTGKTVEEILEVYNPPETEGITPGYHNKAFRIMSDIENMNVDTSVLAQA
jgi:hypothetical protein